MPAKKTLNTKKTEHPTTPNTNTGTPNYLHYVEHTRFPFLYFAPHPYIFCGTFSCFCFLSCHEFLGSFSIFCGTFSIFCVLFIRRGLTPLLILPPLFCTPLYPFLFSSFARPHLFLLHPPIGFLTSPIAPPYIFLLHLRIFPRLLGAYD